MDYKYNFISSEEKSKIINNLFNKLEDLDLGWCNNIHELKYNIRKSGVLNTYAEIWLNFTEAGQYSLILLDENIYIAKRINEDVTDNIEVFKKHKLHIDYSV